MSLSQQQLVDTAVRQTGLEDFGADSHTEGLRVLLDSIEREANLNALGEAAIAAQLGDMLANRLRVVDCRRRNPEIAAEKIARPVFVLGMPRTGTTLLSYLLDCDPARRSLMRWEAMSPCPPPEAAHFADDPRIATAQAHNDMLDALNPRFKSIHYEAADGPTECVTILAQEFKSLLFESELNIPTYGEWLLNTDLHSAYEWHRDVLQLLQWRAPGRWALKTPQHSLALEILSDLYPDGRFVVTHRDPLEVTASVCSLVECLSGTFSDSVDRSYIARHWPEVLAASVGRMMSFRDRVEAQRFFDVPYRDLVERPLDVMRDVYRFLGDSLSNEAERQMAAYLGANPQNKFGRHRYSAADTGIDVERCEQLFAPYRERFALPRPRRE